MNKRIYTFSIVLFLLTGMISCKNAGQRSWTSLIPQESVLVYTSGSATGLSSDSDGPYSSIFDDLTPAPLQQILVLQNTISDHSVLKSVVLYPASSTHSEFIWINQTNATLGDWAPAFYEPFSQNEYAFKGITVHKLTLSGFQVYAAQVNEWLIFSPSSHALESSLRSYTAPQRSVEMPADLQAGNIIVNAGKLDNWLEQLVNVKYRPALVNAFAGFQPVQMEYLRPDQASSSFRFTGTIPLSDTSRSVLVESVSSKNKPITLDRFIASNAGAFALMRKAADLNIDQYFDATTELTPLDSLLISDQESFRDIALSLSEEFAVVTFPESGLLATGEYLFLRKLESSATLKSKIESLADRGVIAVTGNSYFIRSTILSAVLGTSMVPFSDFYLSFSRDVAVLSRRRGLSESVESDRSRRRVIYYNSAYSAAKKNVPDSVSAFTWAKTDDLLKFLSPVLFSSDQINSLLGSFDITMSYMKQNPNGRSVEFNIQSVTEEGSTQPYDERWVLPLNSEELTAPPVLADLIGNPAKEVLVATRSGQITALAYDGTVVMRANTDGEIPVGGPVVYDWYGNGQPIIMIAAGTRVYAWNETGNPLPQFPLEIGERISAPIIVTDVLRNGIPEVIVTTENRRIHVIDGRGQDVRGWPQFTNGVVTQKPVFAEVDGTWSIWTFSENIMHSWLRSGGIRPGYPTFVNAPFTSSPVIYNDQILASATDGYIYNSGTNPAFSDSVSISIQMDSVSIKAVYASNSTLSNLSVEKNVLLKNETGFFRSDLIITQSVNGSLFLFDPAGKLILTYSLGQPASPTFDPRILDLNNDGKKELVALADFGRLFAWDILTGERVFSIPTSGMKYPLIDDMNGDGNMELIALTREGLRCWTINTAD